MNPVVCMHQLTQLGTLGTVVKHSLLYLEEFYTLAFGTLKQKYFLPLACIAIHGLPSLLLLCYS